MQKSKAQRSGELSTRVAVETLMAYADVSEARPSPTVFEIEIRFERELTDDIEVFEQEFKSLYEEWRASKTKIDAKRFMAAMAIRQFVIELDENKALKPLHGNPIKIDFHNIAIGPKDKGQRNGTYDVFMKFNVPAYNQYNAVAWLDDQLQRVCYNQNGMAGMYEFTWKGHIKDRQKFRKAEADFIEALKHVHVNGTNPDMPGTLEQMAGERGMSTRRERRPDRRAGAGHAADRSRLQLPGCDGLQAGHAAARERRKHRRRWRNWPTRRNTRGAVASGRADQDARRLPDVRVNLNVHGASVRKTLAP
jgi:hypothetical protein